MCKGKILENNKKHTHILNACSLDVTNFGTREFTC